MDEMLWQMMHVYGEERAWNGEGDVGCIPFSVQHAKIRKHHWIKIIQNCVQRQQWVSHQLKGQEVRVRVIVRVGGRVHRRRGKQ